MAFLAHRSAATLVRLARIAPFVACLAAVPPVTSAQSLSATPILNYVTLDDGSTGTFLTGIRGDTIVGNIVVPGAGTGGVLYSQSAASWQAFPTSTASGTNYPDATSSSPYGPGFGSADGVLLAVGSYKTAASGAYDIGYLYDAATAPGQNLTTLFYPGSATLDTIPHSTFGNEVVGNYDTRLATGNAFVYAINIGTYVTNNYPGATSTTAYGVWGNMIAGGTTIAGIGLERGYIYNETTNTWTLYNHPGALFTHFEGISGGGQAGSYNLVADWAGPNGAVQASVLHIAPDGTQTWIDLSITGAATVSANSIYGDTAIGVYTTADGAVNGYTVAIPGIYNPISNTGTLTATANSSALSGSQGDDLLNTGTIRTSGSRSVGLSGDTYGVVNNSGSVAANGAGSIGVALNGQYGTLLNSGSITAATGAYAIRTGATALGTVVVNTGSIDGQVVVNAGPQVRFENSGWLGISSPGSGVTHVVSGSFVQTQSGTLAPRVAEDGSDQLQVGGIAVLGGTLAPIAQGSSGGGAPVIGQQFPIVTAQGGVVGSFATLAQPAGLAPNTRLDALYGASVVDLVVTPASYASFAGNDFAAAVANVLDTARPAAGTAMSPNQSAVYAPLYTLPANAILPTLQQLAPVIYSDTLMVNRGTFQMVESAVDDVLQQSRGAPGAVGASNASGPLGTNVWLQGTGQFVGLSNGDNGAPGYHGSSGGVVVGIDGTPHPGTRIGVAVGFNSQSINAANDATYSGQAVQVEIYGSARSGIAFVDAQLGAVYTEGNSTRTIPAFGVSADGDVDGLGAGGSVRGGVRLDAHGWGVEPSLTLSGLALNQRGLTETTGGNAAMAVNGSSVASLQTLLGVQVDHRFPLGGAYAVVPSAQIGWAHEMLDTTVPTTAQFVALPGTPFTVSNPSIGRDAAVASLQAVLETGSRLQAFVAYAASLNGLSSAQSVTGGIRYVW
jgi:subtilase-type serine protease